LTARASPPHRKGDPFPPDLHGGGGRRGRR
jgi:hypothetical protein